MKKLIAKSVNHYLKENYESEDNQFAADMYAMEDILEDTNPIMYEEWTKSTNELWQVLGVEDWLSAFKTDPMSCYALKQELESLINNF